MSEKINDILLSWQAGRNVLLYGPPATGKTRLISELFEALGNPRTSDQGILLDVSDAEKPFTRPELEITIPQPVKVVWTTFHQSYGYEDFVLGLRPEISGSGTALKPWSGIFLDAALELADSSSEYRSVVIFIDEINRGNAARIFGEFMTFLDFDYREDGSVPLPLPLRQLAFSGGSSEQIFRPGGKKASIPEGFTFPKNIYIAATMNSVDRAAVPIDSALARRFDRIELRPDPDFLASQWGLDTNAVKLTTNEKWDTLTPFETAYLLLDRLNVEIASDLGPEFELGHGLLATIRASDFDESGATVAVDEKLVWKNLAKAWDDVLFPQLEDRYSGRPEQLMELLRVETPPPTGDFAWVLRATQTGSATSRTLAPVRVSKLDIDVIRRSFQWLAM